MTQSVFLIFDFPSQHLGFQGVHVTINARTETDLDPDDVTKKVAKASGANYSVHQEKPKAPSSKPTRNAKKEDSPGPVVNGVIPLIINSISLAPVPFIKFMHKCSFITSLLPMLYLVISKLLLTKKCKHEGVLFSDDNKPMMTWKKFFSAWLSILCTDMLEMVNRWITKTYF